MAIDRISGIALLLLAVFVAVETRVLPLGDHSNPGPGYLPLLLASILAGLAVAMIVRTKGSPLWKTVQWKEKSHALAIVACCFFATFCVEPLGYRITMVLILGFLFGVLERMKIWWALILALALAWGSFWVFDGMLMVPLPRGGLGI
jgi:putative tricarboxylic transport membrane protein